MSTKTEAKPSAVRRAKDYSKAIRQAYDTGYRDGYAAYETLGDYENAMLYIKEAIEIAPEEINYKRQAKDIAQKMNDKEKVDFYSSQISRLEQLLRQRG